MYSRIGTALVTMLVFSGSLMAQQRITVLPESRLWIEGRSTMNTFTCEARHLEGHGEGVEGHVQGLLAVPIASLDCGNRAMNHDMQTALKADSFPQIQFVMNRVDARLDAAAEPGDLVVHGALRLAGAEQPIGILVAGQPLSDNRYQATGHVALLMSDFGITPPTAIFGLIRAYDGLVVHFELVAMAESTMVAEDAPRRLPADVSN